MKTRANDNNLLCQIYTSGSAPSSLIQCSSSLHKVADISNVHTNLYIAIVHHITVEGIVKVL